MVNKILKILVVCAVLVFLSGCGENAAIRAVRSVQGDGRLNNNYIWSVKDNPDGEGKLVYTGVADDIVFLVVDGEVTAMTEGAEYLLMLGEERGM